jgi:hypothetical protein
MNNENNHPGAAVNQEQMAEPVVISLKPSVATMIVLSIFILPLTLVLLYAAFFGDNTMAGRIVAGCFGGFLLLLWALLLGKTLSPRKSFVAIGPMGINRHLNDDQWIRWDEIGAVGISVLYTKVPAPNAGAALIRAILPFTRMDIVVRLRIAGVEPGLPSRPDLRKWLAYDEPAPYTHKVFLPCSPSETLKRLRSVELAHEALSRYAGSLYTGVDYRENTRKPLHLTEPQERFPKE